VCSPPDEGETMPFEESKTRHASLREEVVELARELIRLDTVNPPGNEARAADLLRAYLEDAGVACEVYAKTKERANLVARIPGANAGKRLLLLSHTDTVLAEPAEWTVDPWSGDLRDGEVWGRGALDMKGQVAAAAVAVAALAREGFVPTGDLIFAATADEEVGTSDFGLSWLVREHPEAVRAEYCVNEGGGDRIVVDGRAFYLCDVAEKRSAPFVLRVQGRSGHASLPAASENALVRASRLIERLAAFRDEPRLLPETEALMTALVGDARPADALAHVRERGPEIAAIVEPMLALTVSPTMIEASRKRNVVPGLCEVTCDCRLLPGQGRREAEEALRRCLGDDGYEIVWIESVGGSRSSPYTPLWAALASWVAREEPGAEVLPIVLPGFTDSHYLREAFGTIAYGFFPARAMPAALASRLVHSADERIPIDDLELGTRFLRDLARTLLSA
ncbi:MAG: M20/M25/M40 family metallo-hydrolase, partial [Actinomycetota bacterium]|nr:M20/M25/M40 family metallo-hydrolase [Actinomycetota bacterium]